MRFEELLGVNPWTAVFTLANTVALFVVAKKCLFGPVMRMIQDRQNEIDGMYADAESAKAETQALQSEYQRKLESAAEESQRLVKEAVARGQSREEEILRQANREAAAILDKAAADIAQEKKKAINDAKNEISGIAIAIANKVLCREISEKDQVDLVDSFINELGEGI